jgi:hypothetical protein
MEHQQRGTVMPDFRGELRALINSYSKENQSDTPDFILAEFMDDCLRAFDAATVRREEWYGRIPGEAAGGEE